MIAPWPSATALLIALAFAAAAACIVRAGLILRDQLEGSGLAGAAKPTDRNDARSPQMKTLRLQTASETARQLAQAGFDHPDAARWFNYAKLGGMALGAAVGLLLVLFVPVLGFEQAHMRLAVIGTIALLGYYLPTSWMDRRRQAYKLRIAKAIPDALDFMLVCVEAGQSIDKAVQRVTEELGDVHPDLARLFLSVSEALSAGADRHEAFMQLAWRTDNDDLRQFSTIVVQATLMGTPVANTLRVFSADLRDRRVRQIEEKANVLPTKMTMGTMIFTVPPLLILLLAPSIARLTDTMK